MASFPSRAFALLCLVSSFAAAVAAQPAPTPEPPAAEASVGEEPSGIPVMLDGEEVFRVQGGHVGAMTPEHHAEIAERRVLQIAQDPFCSNGLTPVPVARAVLLDSLHEVSRLAREPQWYDAFSHDCTTTIRYHTQNVAPGNPFDWRILVNGRLDALGYERGTIDTTLPFEELRERSDVTRAAAEAVDAPDFTARIRRDLPDPRAGS